MPDKYTLPNRLSPESVFELLTEVKDRPSAKEEDIQKRVSEYSRARSALVEWGLVNPTNGQLMLTHSGQELAWSRDKERQDLLVRHVIMSYEPYEVVLSLHLKDWKPKLEVDQVIELWARKLNITLSKEVTSRAASTMFQMMEAAGLGTYVIGRGGNATRIEFNGEAADRLKSLRAMDGGADVERSSAANSGAMGPVTTSHKGDLSTPSPIAVATSPVQQPVQTRAILPLAAPQDETLSLIHI